MGLVPILKEQLHYRMTHSNCRLSIKQTKKHLCSESFAEINLRLQVQVDIGATVNWIGLGSEM